MDIYKPHKNSPPHWFVSNAIYMVTGSTLYGKPLLDSDAKLINFYETLVERASILKWTIAAWVVMPTHYHFIARSPENALSLKALIQGVHSITAKFVNRMDGTPGRKVWYNYWDSCIQSEASYYARMWYVMMNPVKHGLVQRPEDYPFSSHKYFLENSESDFRKVILSCTEEIQIEDNY
jgi:REP-associated tyrosine transposase